MVEIKESRREKYHGFSFPESLIQEIKKHRETHQEYRSDIDFIRQAIQLRLDVDNGKILIPRKQPLTKDEALTIFADLVAEKIKEKV